MKEESKTINVCQPFKDVSNKWDSETGGERHVAMVTETFWVSVLHRRTGFGHWEWETAIVRIRPDSDQLKYARGKWDDRELFIVRGDHRQELEGKTEKEIMSWYAEHQNEKNSMETFLQGLIK